MNTSHGARYRSADPRPPRDPDRPVGRRGRPACGARILGCVPAWLLLVGSLLAQAAPPAATNATRFRLIYAPFSKIDELAQGDYRTMRRDEFDERIKALQRQVPAELKQGASLTFASYTARLEGRRLLAGSAIWEVANWQDQPTWLSLGQLNLAFADPRWLQDASETANRVEANLGTHTSGDCLLAVPSSGTLQARWTLAPTLATNDELVFDVQLPACPVSRFDLQIPADFALLVDRGVARQLLLDQDPAAAQSSPATMPAVDVWQIDLGGHRNCQFRLRRRNARPPQVKLRQLTRYGVSEQGLDVTADLSLDCDEVELSRLELRIDPPLRVTKVVHESQALTWSEDGQTETSRVATIEFGQPLRGLNRTVRISAVATPDVAAAWQLPRIGVNHVDWLQESARLQINPPFVLQDLQLSQGLRARTIDENASGPRTLAFQFFDADYHVQLRLATEAKPANFKTATNLLVGPNELLATMEVDARSRSADQFEIDGYLQEDWNLEAVEAAAEVIDEWQVVSSPTAPREFQLRFRKPLSTDAWTRLTLRAHRAFKRGSQPLPIERLRPVVFADTQDAPRQFLSIPPQAGVDVSFPQDGQITWLSLDDLDARETRLIGPQTRDRLILLDRPSLNQTVILNDVADQAAPVTAKLRLTTQLSSRVCKEQLRIELARVQRPPQQFHVHLSQARPSELRWYLEQAPQQELSAQRVPDDGDAGEIWQIAWPESPEESLVVIGERSWPASAKLAIALARVTEAETQEGTVVIEAAADVDLSVQASPLLTPLPAGETAFRRFDNLRYLYRYAPLAEIFADDNPLSVSTAPPADNRSNLIVWRATLETHFDPSDVAHTYVSFWTESLGAEQLRIRLPAGSILRPTSVAGEEVTAATDANGWLQVPLPVGERFPLVQVHYDHPQAPAGWIHGLQFAAPEVAAAIVHWQWHLWTPPDFGIAIDGGRDPAAPSTNLLLPRLRAAPRRPFNLFAPSDWRNQLRRLAPRDDRLTAMQTRALEALGQPEQLTVGNWIASLGPLGVRIDRMRLAELDIQPLTTLPATQHPDNLRRGIDRLQQLHLCLLEVAGELTVTTESVLAELPTAVVCRAAGNVASLGGPAATDWQDADRESAFHPRLPASEWQASAVTWPDDSVERAPYIAAGWHVHKISAPAAVKVTVFREPQLRVLSHVAWLVSLSLAWWWGRINPRRALLIPVGCLIAALLVSYPLSIVGLNAVWGSLLGYLVPRFHRRVPVRPNEPSMLIRPLAARLTVGALIVTVVLSAARAALGQPAAPRPLSPPAVQEVYVPTDAQGQPLGEHLFVPLALQRQLLQNGAANWGESPGWVLAQATYTGVLEPQADATQLQLNTITADFELHVTNLGGAIQFPLAAEAVAALKREAFLDGRRIQLQWDATRSTLALPIQQTGRHHVQLSFQTLTTTDAGRARVELPIPTTPIATLLLSSPQDLQPIQVPSARGAIQRREATGQLRAELGPSDRLQIAWPTTASASATPAIDQLSWLRLERDEVRYDVQLIPDANRLLDTSLVLEVDERLQLDVAMSDQPLSLAPAAERGVRRLEFDLTGATPETAMIQLSFVFTGTTGIGHVQLPRCRILNHAVSHWLAVSADPRLGLRVTPDNAVPLPVETFVARWGGSQSPDFAYDLPAAATHWACQGQWIETPPDIEIQEAQIVGREGTRVIQVATFRSEGSELFQQAIQLPEAMRIESLQKLPAGPGAPLRWSRFARDQITVFFDDPPIGTFQIGIVGFSPDEALDHRRLPQIRFPKTTINRHQVDLFREVDVLLVSDRTETPAAPPELVPFIRNQLGPARWQSRVEQPTEATWEVQLQANERRLRAELDNVISREQGVWYHRLQVQVQMEQGVLDSLTFELPEAWTAGLPEDAGLRITFAQASQPGMVRVTFQPQQQPFNPTSPILFSGPIPVSPGQPLAVPNIRLLDEGQIVRRLFLPVSLEDQTIVWSTSGLEPLEEVEVPAAMTQPNATYQAYRIPDGQFQATRLAAKSAVGAPTISLVDVHIAWREAGRFQGLAMFDLWPDGLDECLVQFPDGLRPIALYCDESPVRLPAVTEPAAGPVPPQRVKLASNELPQRVRVVFEGKASGTAALHQHDISLPRLRYQPANRGEDDREIAAERTLLTLYQITPGTLQLSDDAVSADELDQRRLAHYADVLERATQLATDFTTQDLERWYSVWGRRLLTTQRRVRTPAQPISSDTTEAGDIVRQIRQRHAAVVPQLKVDTVFQQLQADPDLSDTTNVWIDALPTATRVHYRDIAGDLPELPIQFRAPTPWSRPLRLAAATLVGLLGLLLQRWPRYLSMGPQWAVVTCVLAGLAWWLWLEPSLLGWAIVGLSLLVMALLP